MIISISNAVQETFILEILLVLALVISARRLRDPSFFSLDTTTELRGLAILMVVFAHIGYFLVEDHRFLVPLSNYGGVGVDLFFILSGYGLVATALQQPLSIGKFYIKRLARVYVPVLITLGLFLLLDFVLLRQTYPAKVIAQSLFGFFPQADLYTDINSPLWYITPLLAYYFLFPLIFWRRRPLLSAAAMAGIGLVAVYNIAQSTVFSEVVVSLYKLHFLAFPLGVALGALVNQPPLFLVKPVERIGVGFKKYHLANILRLGVLALAGYIVVYTHYHSGFGEGWKIQSTISLCISMALLTFFLFKKINYRVLSLFGLFSFEIYLLHWPLLYRYDFLYGNMPASLATIIYLALFLGVGYLYHKLIGKIFDATVKPASLSNLS